MNYTCVCLAVFIKIIKTGCGPHDVAVKMTSGPLTLVIPMPHIIVAGGSQFQLPAKCALWKEAGVTGVVESLPPTWESRTELQAPVQPGSALASWEIK